MDIPYIVQLNNIVITLIISIGTTFRRISTKDPRRKPNQVSTPLQELHIRDYRHWSCSKTMYFIYKTIYALSILCTEF